jgi:outer membrane PBP1 activator LpoA protein
MLHARHCGRQVHGWLLAGLLGVAVACLAPSPAEAGRKDDLATADQLARSGQNAAAAAIYESLARRAFGRWDNRMALLAAREYLAAGQLDDSERLLATVRGRVRSDDAVLRARIEAEVSLARGRPNAAIEALQAVPEPWPAPLAAELLALRAQAEFRAGRWLDGMRSIERRAAIVGTAEERRENYALLVDALRANPGAAAAVPADASPNERAWFELGQLLVAGDTDAGATARRAADWRTRHPHHPGADFLPATGTTAAAAVAGTPVAIPLSGSADVIALLLPLSGRQQSAGHAVQDGFLAGALSESPDRRPRIDIYDTAALGVGPAYQKALTSGAQAVAGPLTKEELAALVGSQSLPLPTLALNALGGAAPPAFLFQFALDPEQEARAAARRIAEDGYLRGIALFPRSTWGDRLFEAFTAELQSTGIELTSAQFYDPAERDFSGPLRTALGRYGGAGDRNAKGEPVRRDAVAEARDGPQFAFIAASAQTARAIRPQLRFQMSYDLAVYATSDAWDPATRSATDLEGLTFPEMPWILHAGQGAPELWQVLHQSGGSAGARSRLRLYAFGFDAYQLLRGLNIAARGVAVDGLTGRLVIAPDGRVTRELEWARVQGGRPEVAGAYPPLAAPIEP